MTPQQKTELRGAIRDAITSAVKEIGVEAFKRTSWFGSNDPAFQKEAFKKAA